MTTPAPLQNPHVFPPPIPPKITPRPWTLPSFFFVRANGVTYRDDTRAIKALLAGSRDDLVKRLRTKRGWSDLTALVHVRPKRDLFPVRAQYPGGDTLNIGLNYLSADEPQWFTLADVLASKILTGKTPEVVAALWFEPRDQQTGLKPIDVAGQSIDPATDDFYQRLIVHRNVIKAKLNDSSEADKPALRSDEQGIKILANATSYGIFVELNVEDYVTAKPMIGHGGRSRSLRFKSKEFEKPGAYFHPLLATLITGALRLPNIRSSNTDSTGSSVTPTASPSQTRAIFRVRSS